MNVKITPFDACGTVSAPPSKSFAHRLIIAALLSGGDCFIENVGDSEDVKATVYAVSALGAEVNYDGKNVYVGKVSVPSFATVDCVESGSALRFFIPVAAALGVDAEFTGTKTLMSRPTDAYKSCFSGHGAEFDGKRVSGKLTAGKYVLDASLSSQYVSGLLLALSAVKGESEIVLTGKTVSKGYTDMTAYILKKFGAEISETSGGYRITGGNLKAPERIRTEGDWSGAAFFLSLGAICGNVKVKGLDFPSLQKDSGILDILEKFGAKVTVKEDFISVKRGNLTAVKDIDCENIPDLAQVIAVIAAYAEGVTSLINVERLKIKESDRIVAIIKTLAAAGIRAEYDGKELKIHGGLPVGGIFDGGNDHRTVMSAAVLAAGATANSEIVGAEAHAKSYVGFFTDYRKAGGKYVLI